MRKLYVYFSLKQRGSFEGGGGVEEQREIFTWKDLHASGKCGTKAGERERALDNEKRCFGFGFCFILGLSYTITSQHSTSYLLIYISPQIYHHSTAHSYQAHGHIQGNKSSGLGLFSIYIYIFLALRETRQWAAYLALLASP
jgi:hypothetical protein